MSVMKLSLAVILVFAIGAAAPGACSSDTTGGTGTAGASGGGTSGGTAGTSGGTAGTLGGAGTSGNAGTTGNAGRGGTTGSAGTTGAGGSGTQPIGAACANTGNCSQVDGPAVCCLQISTCVIDTQCPTGTNYVPCTDTASCNKGGWVCCNAGGMRFCTKQSGCPTP